MLTSIGLKSPNGECRLRGRALAMNFKILATFQSDHNQSLEHRRTLKPASYRIELSQSVNDLWRYAWRLHQRPEN